MTSSSHIRPYASLTNLTRRAISAGERPNTDRMHISVRHSHVFLKMLKRHDQNLRLFSQNNSPLLRFISLFSTRGCLPNLYDLNSKPLLLPTDHVHHFSRSSCYATPSKHCIINTHIYLHTHAYTHMHTCMHIDTYTHIHTHMHVLHVLACREIASAAYPHFRP